MGETTYEPLSWQYVIDRDWTWVIIKANIPVWVDAWRIVYSRGPEELASVNDDICIDDNWLILLEYLILKRYAEANREFTTASYYKNEFNEALKKEEENQERLPYRIIGNVVI